MSRLKFAILRHGTIETDLAYNVAVPSPANVHNKNPPAVWVRCPCFSVLFYHPQLGWCLYDTGFCPGDEAGTLPQWFQDSFPLVATPQDYLVNRLAQVGLTKDDISLVILSHTHWDHIGGMGLFSNTQAGQKVLAPGPDYSYGITNTHRTTEEIFGGYFRKSYHLPGICYDFVEEDTQLAQGVHLITLEGHTPMVLGLILQLESGNYIFPSDAMGHSLNYGPPARPGGTVYDSLGFERTVKKLGRLQKKYDAHIIFAHDPEQFQTLEYAPYFYE